MTAWVAPAASLGTAFVLSLAIAWFYTRLHRGQPYLRTFPQALAVAGVISSLLVLAIGDSIARGVGLIGAVALVRFRSNLRDPRDLIFAFAAFAVGVAAGASAYAVAVAGTAIFMCAMLLVSQSWFAQRDAFDAVITLQTPMTTEAIDAIGREFRTRCRQHTLLRVRQTGPASQEHAYQVGLKDQHQREALVQALASIQGVRGTQLIAFDSSKEL
ncbi:MAG TPA: DUF4956 domain-containing protein [Vicinamibacterales bacterium]|nr:DUF4956 domain-containing protein [Vicinamibacterales bacterium]